MTHFMQASDNITGQKTGATNLDCVRTIDIAHHATPEQRERYAALYHFRYHPKYMERGPMKSRLDYQETTRAIVSMSMEAGQNPQIVSTRNKCRDDLDPEKLKWLTWLLHNWKFYFAVNRHSENLNFTQLPCQELMESQPLETVQLLRKNGLRRLIIGECISRWTWADDF